MALTQDFEKRLSEMVGDEDQEAVQVAGLGRAAVKEALSGMRGKRGTDAEIKRPREPKETPEEIVPEEPPVDGVPEEPSDIAPETAPPSERPDLPGEAAPDPIEIEPDNPPYAPLPKTEQDAEALLKAREAQVGSPRQVPSPSKAQKEAGIVEGRINTRFYDDDGLAATVQAVAEGMPEFKSRTIQSLYDDAKKKGVSTSVMDALFSGKSMETKIGNDQLATNQAALMMVHDASAERLDELMAKMSAGELDDAGMLDLREVMTRHEIIVSALDNSKRDVARAMNVYKNISQRDTVALSEIRAALDNAGGEEHLRALSEKYLKAGTRANKNAAIKRGLFLRSYDAAVYSAQSVLLSNPETHLFNGLANAGFMGLDMTERLFSPAVGKMRQRLAKMLGKDYDKDRYMLDDFHARTTAMGSTLVDGFVLMGRALKESEGAGKAEQFRNPLKTEYLFGREISRARGDGKLKSGMAAVWDGMATAMSMPFKALQVGDELFGGMASRMQLNEDALRTYKKVFDDALESGASADEAKKAGQNAAEKLLTERPAPIQQNMDEVRQMLTLQGPWDLDTKTGMAFWKTQKGLNYFKFMVMFNRTLLKITSETSARIPGLNLMSPRFQSEWKKGGKHRDLAIARLGVGSGLLYAGYHLANTGRITGGGPSDTNERNNLRQLGWQEFSLTFGEDEYTPASIKKLRAILGEDAVTEGRGQLKGQLFVSLKRLEPVNTPFLLGAAFNDINKFSVYEDGIMDKYMLPAMGALSEYTTNIPALTEVGRVMSSINTRAEDNVDVLASVVNTVLRAGVTFTLNAAPVVNLANSSLAAKIERVMDPTMSLNKIDRAQDQWLYEMGVTDSGDFRYQFARPFFEAYNRFRSRVPAFSKGVPPRLDELGDPIGADKSMLLSAAPAYISKGKSARVRELLAAIHHAPSEPSVSFNGVTLPAEVQNRYKDLYANKIKINGRNLKTTLIDVIEGGIDRMERLGSRRLGLLQKDVDKEVARFRAAARDRMFGKFIFNERLQLWETSGAPVPGREYGLVGAVVEYPDLVKRIMDNRNKAAIMGN